MKKYKHLYEVTVWFEDDYTSVTYAVNANSAQGAVDIIDKRFEGEGFPFQVIKVMLDQTVWYHKGYRP